MVAQWYAPQLTLRLLSFRLSQLSDHRTVCVLSRQDWQPVPVDAPTNAIQREHTLLVLRNSVAFSRRVLGRLDLISGPWMFDKLDRKQLEQFEMFADILNGDTRSPIPQHYCRGRIGC